MSAKVALVTGGIGGIGTEVCKALSRRGRRVVAGHLPEEIDAATQWKCQLREHDCAVETVAGDVACFESSRAMIEEVVARFGTVQILVNCAGITRDRTLRRMEAQDWQAVMATNLDSVFNVTRHVVEGMVEQGFGRVINISSVNGQKGQFGQTNYSASKAGVHGFTMALAQEVASKGITVNTVSPGYVATPMTDAVPEEIRSKIVESIPVGRFGEPHEIAHVIAFLSDEESGYITGANIPINGGLYMCY